MTLPVFQFTNEKSAAQAFSAQAMGTDPYTPGRRCRAMLAEVLSWGIDLQAVARAVATQGGALLTGLPVDPELPLSPPEGKRPTDKATSISEGLLNAVSFALGMHPVAFHNEKGGDLVHQIVPVPGREGSISNQGAGVFLMHTEGTHLPTPPDVLALVCVRNLERGATNFASLDAAMADAPDWVVQQLRLPKYTLPISESYGINARYTIPIIKGPDTDPIYRVDFTDVLSVDEESERALAWFRDAVAMHEEVVTLQPGDLIVLNNHRSLHGRVGFVPDYSEGKQRWLQRQYMTRTPLAGERADARYPHVWRG